jgi:acyl-coenzyme A thioesterase PaaI-like protein
VSGTETTQASDATHEPDADGWRQLDIPDPDGFDARISVMRVRALPGMRAEAVIQTGQGAANSSGRLHGGFIAAVVEQCLFLPLHLHGRVSISGTVTIDFSLQYLAGGNVELPLLAQVEMLRETGRMAFVRGTLVQAGEVITAFSSTLRKVPAVSRTAA